MIENCERYCLRVIQGEERGFVAKTVLNGLSALSLGYRAAAGVRTLGYERGLLSTYTAPVPVISIGNLVAGGTGKTPLTLKLARELSSEYQVAILTRGYRSEQEKASEPASVGEKLDAVRYGDEACLLASRLPGVQVVVGRDRVKGAILATKQGAEIILLDDGMQHRRLFRDGEVVVIDSEDPWGKNHFLPRGFLRESPKALERATLIVVNHCENAQGLSRIERDIRKFSKAPLVATKPVTTAEQELSQVSVGLLSGIAKPEKFEKRLQEMGAHIVAKEISLDHRAPDADTVELFAIKAKAKGASCLVCTEKDRMKLVAPKTLPLVTVKMDLEIVAGEENWQQLINQIKEMVVTV